VHDGIGGNIAAIKMLVDSMLMLPKKDPAVLFEKLQYLEQLIDLTLVETRRISNSLRPELIELELEEALPKKLDRLAQKTGATTQFYSNKTTEKPSERAAFSIIKSCSELLDHLQQRWDLTQVSIILLFSNDSLSVELTDHTAPNKHKNKMKISDFPTIQARMIILGGDFNIVNNSDDTGSVTTMKLPLNSKIIKH